MLTVLYCTVLNCTVLYCTVLYCTVLYCTVWRCGDLLARATNPAMRSDVLRLEILYKYGGIYADIDSVALRSFGELQTVDS